jgi:aldose 1-epimerase
LKLESVEMADDMKVTVSYQYKKEYDYYPFSFQLDITYQLDAPDQFSVFVEIKNTGTGNMPFGFGWHPYFCLGEPVKNLSLQFPKVKRVLLNKNIIPTGEKEGYEVFENLSKVGVTILDDCFVLDNPQGDTAAITLWSEKQQYGVKVWQEASADKFPFIQIYTPSNDLNYLAIEPMTCSIDAFNNGDGLQVLGAGESFSGKFGVSLI